MVDAMAPLAQPSDDVRVVGGLQQRLGDDDRRVRRGVELVEHRATPRGVLLELLAALGCGHAPDGVAEVLGIGDPAVGQAPVELVGDLGLARGRTRR